MRLQRGVGGRPRRERVSASGRCVTEVLYQVGIRADEQDVHATSSVPERVPG
jgi:hypothetical protein